MWPVCVQQNADQMKKQLDQQVKATQGLIANTRCSLLLAVSAVSNAASLQLTLAACRTLEQKLTEAKNKKDTLKARAKSANSAKQINDMMQGLDINNAMTAFERMEEKVMSLESESQATMQARLKLLISP